ncbi:MAG: hypothetical protein EA376_02190 [Phycisphaeraceae bacterium]|nr:MAG: hypothetical protein EA376_02190 [Phycisphaeraceae bacterium]
MDAHAPSRTTSPSLRLIGADRPGSDGARRRALEIGEALRRRAVARANQAAARLPESDARMLFAASVAQSLDGGRAAILTPDRRERLVENARRMGMRAFDANLIIAIVQDDARRGGRGAQGETARLITIVPGPKRSPWSSAAGLALAAMAFAGAGMALLIAWVLR